MATERVTVNRIYEYRPVLLDQFMPPCGVESGLLKPGDRVRVVNLPNCPRANTMGQCHIETLAGQFAGLVNTTSLEPVIHAAPAPHSWRGIPESLS